MSIDSSKNRPGDIGRELQLNSNRDSSSVLNIGVVEEVIYMPDFFDFSLFYDRVDSPNLLNNVPANSLLVRVLTNKEYKSSGNLMLCYPIFPQHIQFPIKVGEHIFFMKYGSVGYWLSRVPDSNSVEDTNYSHGDRKHLQIVDESSTIELAKDASGTKKNLIGIFNNGGESNDNQTFSPNDSYDKLLLNSTTNNSFTREPVPSFKKRPGDLALQGSNNTIIILGQGRGWTKSDEEFGISNAIYKTPRFNDGTIDLIAGRGRYLPDTFTTESEKGTLPIRTSPRTIINELGIIEADRSPLTNNIPINQIEGDPDYEYDASRFKLSISENVDQLFHITEDIDNNYILPKVISWPAGPSEVSNNILPVDNASYGVIKADEIRIIARRQEENVNGLKTDVPEINGSVKIIKEGKLNSEAGDGKAVIAMLPDGTILIDGPTVIIGNAHESLEKNPGEGTHIILGQGATEPIVLGNYLKELLENHFADVKDHINDLKSFLQATFNTHVHTAAGTPTTPTTPPLIPALELELKISETTVNIDKSMNDLSTILSKFGKTK